MTDRSHLPQVRYALTIETAPWGDHEAASYDEEHFHVRRLELDEALDRPYLLELDLITEDLELDIEALVGAELTLSCQREEDERFVHGVIQQAWYLGTFSHRTHLRVQAGPALARLGVGRRSRVFQGHTAVQVVQEVVADAFAAHDRKIDVSRLTRSYDPLDYCVQFRESDLHFLRRILAREGIGFFFEQLETAELMVLFDDPGALRGISHEPSESDSGSMPVVAVATSQADRSELETIVGFDWRRRERPRRIEVSDWDWKPWETERVFGEGTLADPEPGSYGERYEHGARRLVEEDGTGPHLDHTPRMAADLHERSIAKAQAGIGRGNVLAFAPGALFEIEGHPMAALDRGYVLTRVLHRADCPEADIEDAGHFAGANYENRFECIPHDVPWRPALLPRPAVHGHLLATVVGPSGEEIHTDEWGRIKTWIHWDREHGPLDPESSCWMRVAQTWAGAGWGSMFIPRVGMEVLISFADGDPDRPLCVGCVYDGRNKPPYTLPDERTKSTIKSSSSPGGDGFNELRFEDAAGNEEVFLHAQRQLVEQVGNDHTTSVGHDQSISVGHDQTTTVKGSSVTAVDGNYSLTVLGADAKGQPKPGPHLTVMADSQMELEATEKITLYAWEQIQLKIKNGSTLTMTGEDIVLTTKYGATISLAQAASMMSAPGASVVLDPQGGLAMAAMVGQGAPGAALVMDANVSVSSKAGASLVLDGSANLAASSGGASLALDSNAKVDAQEVHLYAQAASLVLDQGAALDGMKVSLSGTDISQTCTSMAITTTQLTATGGAMVTITAPLVKIN